MSNPKVSVMITTYNLEKYIDETLESVVNQKVNFSYEILIGDDGSNDGTIDKIKLWTEKYPDMIRYFVMDRDPNVKHNRIIRASRNRVNLLRNAKGEYLMYLDGDDVYTDENKLQKQVDILDSEEYKDCIACAHNTWEYFDDENKSLINQAKDIRRISDRKYWRDGMYVHSDSIMFRNKVKVKKGYGTVYDRLLEHDFMLDNFDDNLIMFSLFGEGDIIYLPDAMVNYRQVANSSWNSVEELEKNIINIMDIDIERNYRPEYYKETIKRHTFQVYYLWRYSKDMLSGEGEKIKARYLNRMEDENMYEAKKWLCYNEQSFGKKFSMSCWIIWKLICYVPLFIKKRGPKRFN